MKPRPNKRFTRPTIEQLDREYAAKARDLALVEALRYLVERTYREEFHDEMDVARSFTRTADLVAEAEQGKTAWSLAGLQSMFASGWSPA